MFRLTLYETENLKKEELKRKKIIRLKEVRKQSDFQSQILREKFKNAKDNLKSNFIKYLKDKSNIKQTEIFKEQWIDYLSDLGSAHIEASFLSRKVNEEEKNKFVQIEKETLTRYKEAIIKEKIIKGAMNREQDRISIARKCGLEQVNIKTKQILKIKKSASKIKKKTFDNLDDEVSYKVIKRTNHSFSPPISYKNENFNTNLINGEEKKLAMCSRIKKIKETIIDNTHQKKGETDEKRKISLPPEPLMTLETKTFMSQNNKKKLIDSKDKANSSNHKYEKKTEEVPNFNVSLNSLDNCQEPLEVENNILENSSDSKVLSSVKSFPIFSQSRKFEKNETNVSDSSCPSFYKLPLTCFSGSFLSADEQATSSSVLSPLNSSEIQIENPSDQRNQPLKSFNPYPLTKEDLFLESIRIEKEKFKLMNLLNKLKIEKERENFQLNSSQMIPRTKPHKFVGSSFNSTNHLCLPLFDLLSQKSCFKSNSPLEGFSDLSYDFDNYLKLNTISFPKSKLLSCLDSNQECDPTPEKSTSSTTIESDLIERMNNLLEYMRNDCIVKNRDVDTEIEENLLPKENSCEPQFLESQNLQNNLKNNKYDTVNRLSLIGDYLESYSESKIETPRWRTPVQIQDQFVNSSDYIQKDLEVSTLSGYTSLEIDEFHEPTKNFSQFESL